MALFVRMQFERPEQFALTVEQVESHGPAQERYGVLGFVGIGLDIESRSEHAYRLAARMDDEGVLRIVFDIEIGFAVEPHLAGTGAERGGITQLRRGFHRHLRTVGEHDARLASGIHAYRIERVGKPCPAAPPGQNADSDQCGCRGGITDCPEPYLPPELSAGCRAQRGNTLIRGEFGPCEQPAPHGFDIHRSDLRCGIPLGVKMRQPVKQLCILGIAAGPFVQRLDLLQRGFTFEIGDQGGFECFGDFFHRSCVLYVKHMSRKNYLLRSKKNSAAIRRGGVNKTKDQQDEHPFAKEAKRFIKLGVHRTMRNAEPLGDFRTLQILVPR